MEIQQPAGVFNGNLDQTRQVIGKTIRTCKVRLTKVKAALTFGLDSVELRG